MEEAAPIPPASMLSCLSCNCAISTMRPRAFHRRKHRLARSVKPAKMVPHVYTMRRAWRALAPSRCCVANLASDRRRPCVRCGRMPRRLRQARGTWLYAVVSSFKARRPLLIVLPLPIASPDVPLAAVACCRRAAYRESRRLTRSDGEPMPRRRLPPTPPPPPPPTVAMVAPS